MRLLLAALCVAYVLNPFPDLIPDSTPIFGTVDDSIAAVFAWVLASKRS